MRNLIFLILVLLTGFSYAQVGNVYYKKQLSTSTDDVDNEYMIKAIKSLNNRQYKLSFKNTEAVYKEVKSMSVDDSPLVEAFVNGLSEFDGEVYFNQQDEKIIHKREFAGNNYTIRRNKIKWTLSKDTLRIDNYLCYKAATTRIIKNSQGVHKLKIVAWYAPKISLPYGPDGYGGLPGLILQLENNGTTTYLKKIEFLNKNLDINFKTKGKVITEDEFNEIVSKIYNNKKKKY